VVSRLSSSECVFCRIAAGELQATMVHRDDDVLAILDIRPVNPGHTLVLPRRHYRSLADIPEHVGARLFTIGQRTAAAIRRSGLRCEAVRFTLADGAAAGQEVAHLHLHVIPRFAGDAYRVETTTTRPSREELEAVAQAISRAAGPLGNG
jgi:diadenosine tetraphosphate (Ap4A) HIT family hydrolase